MERLGKAAAFPRQAAETAQVLAGSAILISSSPVFEPYLYLRLAEAQCRCSQECSRQ
jgi:hypothetical protein